MAEQLSYKRREPIAKRIVGLIDDGVTMNVILDTIQAEFGTDVPKSTQTIYKLYGDDIAKARAGFQSYLGKKAFQRIEEGSDRILELALRSKAGWKPQESVTIDEGEDSEQGSSALDTIMDLLGKERKNPEN